MILLICLFSFSLTLIDISMKKCAIILLLLLVVGVAKAQPNSGFGFRAELGYGVTVTDSDSPVLSLRAMPGWHLNPYLFMGVGVGYLQYASSSPYNVAQIPLFGHITVNMLRSGRVIPFIDAKIGYNLGWSEKTVARFDQPTVVDMKGGFMWSPGLGAKFRIDANRSFSIGLAFESNTLRYRPKSSSSVSPWTASNYTLNIRLGYEF